MMYKPLFALPKVVRDNLEVRRANLESPALNFLKDLTHKKLLKTVNFHQASQKRKGHFEYMAHTIMVTLKMTIEITYNGFM